MANFCFILINTKAYGHVLVKEVTRICNRCFFWDTLYSSFSKIRNFLISISRLQKYVSIHMSAKFKCYNLPARVRAVGWDPLKDFNDDLFF